MNIEDRIREFWSRVDKSGSCWNWTGAKDVGGYGVFSFMGKRKTTHRLAWELENGCAATPGMVVMHLCDNPACCRPDHLKLGTYFENTLDCHNKGRWRSPAVPFGESHHRAILNDKSVQAIRYFYDRGLARVCEISRFMDVSGSVVSNVINYKTWKHVKPIWKPWKQAAHE
jgi:hypothetical protein